MIWVKQRIGAVVGNEAGSTNSGQITLSSDRLWQGICIAFDYNRKPQENFALGIIFSEELYFQITLAAVWRMDHKEARVKKGAS